MDALSPELHAALARFRALAMAEGVDLAHVDDAQLLAGISLVSREYAGQRRALVAAGMARIGAGWVAVLDAAEGF